MRDDDWNRLAYRFREAVERIETPKEHVYLVEPPSSLDKGEPIRRLIEARLHESDERPEDGVVFELRVRRECVDVWIRREFTGGHQDSDFFHTTCRFSGDRYSTVATVVLHCVGLMQAMTESSAYADWVRKSRGPKTLREDPTWQR